MSDEKLDTILVQALAALEAGETVGQILSRYPVERDQLRPMLDTAVRLDAYGRATRSTRPLRQSLARQAFLTRAAAHSPARLPAGRAGWLMYPLAALLTIAVLAIVVSSGVLAASAASLPGDPLYGVKRSVENIQLSLVADPARRANLEETFSRRRTEEIKAVQAARRSTRVEFAGAIESIGAEAWAIDGLVVRVTDNTVLDGKPHKGAWVKVSGHTLPDGQVVADRIEVEEAEPTATRAPSPTIRVEPSATPKPARTSEPTETSGPHPTEPESSRTPEATRTPRPPETDEPDRTPESSKPPEPTKTREPSRTPERTRAPEPTRAPQVSSTARPTRTPEPQHTSEPTETRRPAQTPEPTKAREPTETPKP